MAMKVAFWFVVFVAALLVWRSERDYYPALFVGVFALGGFIAESTILIAVRYFGK
jgi:hypothetical protein